MISEELLEETFACCVEAERVIKHFLNGEQSTADLLSKLAVMQKSIDNVMQLLSEDEKRWFETLCKLIGDDNVAVLKKEEDP